MIDKHKTITNKTQASEINVSNYCTRKGIRQPCWIESRDRERERERLRNILAKLALITLIYALARLTRPTWLIDVMTDSDIGAICAYLYWKQTRYSAPPSHAPTSLPSLFAAEQKYVGFTWETSINFLAQFIKLLRSVQLGWGIPPSPFSGCPLFVHFIVKLAIKL